MAARHSGHSVHVRVHVSQHGSARGPAPKPIKRKPAKGPKHRRSKATKRAAATSRRTASRSRRRSTAKKNLSGAIKRPGALTRAKKRGESTMAAAQRLKRNGTPMQKRQANYYLNVLAPSSKRRGRSRKRSTKRRRR